MTVTRVWSKTADRRTAMIECRELAAALYGKSAHFVETIKPDEARVALGYTFGFAFITPTKKKAGRSFFGKRAGRR